VRRAPGAPAPRPREPIFLPGPLPEGFCGTRNMRRNPRPVPGTSPARAGYMGEEKTRQYSGDALYFRVQRTVITTTGLAAASAGRGGGAPTHCAALYALQYNAVRPTIQHCTPCNTALAPCSPASAPGVCAPCAGPAGLGILRGSCGPVF